jgi:AraC-like DNA-binding protein
MTLAELREEYRSDRVGPKILNEVRSLVRDVVHRYDPQVYGGASSWDDAEDDIVQSVVVDLLLREGQLDYLMATAAELSDFRNLLRFQVKRYLARKRRRSVIDNLLDRAKELLEAERFDRSGTGEATRYWIRGATVERREPTEEELVAAARSVGHVPRIRSTGSERAPVVYSRDDLETVLQAIGGSLATPFSLGDVARVLELVLTDWVASILYELEGGIQPSPSLGPEEETLAEQAARQILDRCTTEQLVVLRNKLENVADQDIARQLGMSRPTVSARKQEMFDVMRAALSDLPDHVQAAVMDRVAVRLALLHSGANG